MCYTVPFTYLLHLFHLVMHLLHLRSQHFILDQDVGWVDGAAGRPPAHLLRELTLVRRHLRRDAVLLPVEHARVTTALIIVIAAT